MYILVAYLRGAVQLQASEGRRIGTAQGGSLHRLREVPGRLVQRTLPSLRTNGSLSRKLRSTRQVSGPPWLLLADSLLAVFG